MHHAAPSRGQLPLPAVSVRRPSTLAPASPRPGPLGFGVQGLLALLLLALFPGLPSAADSSPAVFYSPGLAHPGHLAAQVPASTGELRVMVRGPGGAPLAGATVRVAGTSVGAFTGADGVASLRGVPSGLQRLTVERQGYRSWTAEVTVSPVATVQAEVSLVLAPLALGGIQVSVLRPDLRPELRVDEETLAATPVHDIGGAFRTLPGLDAIRRGGLGLDPVVRGLRDTQVGAYVDGMRTLPGGPGGMDTPLSHVDPSAIRGMEVVKGPYALTWGAGNLSAVRVETHPLPGPDAPPLAGQSLLGYNSNLQAFEAAVEARGASRPLAWTLSSAWRESEGYRSGDGTPTPGAFESGEIRGRVGLHLSPASTLTLGGWYQGQRGIEYPGRPLNADWFDTWNLSLGWEHRPAEGALRSLTAQGWSYTVDHGMNNDGKPTALPNPDRVPPVAMQIETLSRVELQGARLSTLWDPRAGLEVEVGADGTTALHQASSTNRNRDTGMLMMERLIWGDARLTALGVFTRVGLPVGPFSASGTLRLDHVRAGADTASAFFMENASRELESSETHLSAALTLSLPVAEGTTVSMGAGSVSRPADANERFSDRAPSKRAQIGAEFLGDPGIRPERSHQVDLWVETAHPRWGGSLNLFHQWIDDHISIEETSLPRQSPMSAPTVFRYVNGEARYLGAEATLEARVTSTLSLELASAWLRGTDRTLDEPALGVSPLRMDAGVRWTPGEGGAYLGVTGSLVRSQDRVSATRGEDPTPGYRTLDLQGGIPLGDRITVRGGVNNLFDAQVVNHLNARNPFTGATVPEPGRVLFLRVTARY